MRVFISWSGSRSHAVALVLRDWLPNVIQRLDPWVSSEDISKGAGWLAQIDAELQHTTHGVVCVVPGNETEPWLNYEAGALAKQTGQQRVCVALLGVGPTDLTGPLKGFQATLMLDQGDVFKLMTTINGDLPEDIRLQPDRLKHAFDREWDGLARKLTDIRDRVDADSKDVKLARTDRELIQETLDLVRGLSRARVVDLDEFYRHNISRVLEGVGGHGHLTLGASAAGPIRTVAQWPRYTPVLHETFGVGVVVESEFDMNNANEIATVQFADGGRKRLLVRYAPLSLYDQELPDVLKGFSSGQGDT